MSQTTADDLMTIGMTPVTIENEPRSRAAAPTTAPAKKKGVAIALLATIVLGAGIKVFGDYAAERAIDAWATRQQAQFMLPDPLAVELFQNSVYEENPVQDAAAPEAQPVSVGQ